MKIIAGKYWKKNLISQDKESTRPILTRIRENLFNVLNNYFYYDNKVALDLFAGSGSIGLEALSRNVLHCYFNDYDKDALKCLKQNLQSLKVEVSDYSITNLPYLDCLMHLYHRQVKLDLVFISPPYKEIAYYYEASKYILDKNILNKYGIIIFESNQELQNIDQRLKLLKFKKYGKVMLYFYRYGEGE